METDGSLLDRVENALPYRRDARRLVKNILRSDLHVDDVLQDVHLALWTAASIGQEIGDVRRWVMRAARNRALDIKRKINSDGRLRQAVAGGAL